MIYVEMNPEEPTHNASRHQTQSPPPHPFHSLASLIDQHSSQDPSLTSLLTPLLTPRTTHTTHTTQHRYFNYFYWVINIGALVSYFVLAQMATEPEEFGLWQGWGFFATFGISTGCLLLALTSFFSATGRYIYKPPSGSATAKIFSVIYDASKSSGMGQLLLTGTVVVFFGVIVGCVQAFLDPGTAQDAMTYVAFSCAVIGMVCVLIPTTGMPTWLDPHASADGYALINADQMKQADTTEHRVMMATRVISVLFNTISFQVRQHRHPRHFTDH